MSESVEARRLRRSVASVKVSYRASRRWTDLLRLAGPARFVRGTVTDGRPYLAMVHHRVGRLAGECDCADSRPPESFCEHSVAVGLSYLDEDGAPGG
ncbi:hypothetical protein BH18ACT4_BH18ACT4_04510 [soil metagenome]